MDKYELVLDIIEHPEKYTSEQLDKIFSDQETREIYNLLSKVETVVDAKNAVDVEAEWEDFAHKHLGQPGDRYKIWTGNRAASIAAIIGTSIVAVAAGIAVTVSLTDRKVESVVVNEVEIAERRPINTSESMIVDNDTVADEQSYVMFENEPLETIMKKVEAVYGVEVKFNSREAALLHLYYKFDPALTLDEVISQLNTFEQINIKRNGKILNID